MGKKRVLVGYGSKSDCIYKGDLYIYSCAYEYAVDVDAVANW